MKQLMENELTCVIGGGDYEGALPLYIPTLSTAYIEAILALLAPSRTVHPAD
jgi:hypothetical protein